MVEYPSRRDVRDAATAMLVADSSEDEQEGLEELPCAPGFKDHVEILHGFRSESTWKGTQWWPTYLPLRWRQTSRIGIRLCLSEPFVGEESPTLRRKTKR